MKSILKKRVLDEKNLIRPMRQLFEQVRHFLSIDICYVIISRYLETKTSSKYLDNIHFNKFLLRRSIEWFGIHHDHHKIRI